MNDIWQYLMVVNLLSTKKMAEKIYLAFDAGEWNRREDPSGVDPVEKYTIPALKDLIEKIFFFA